MAHPRLTLFEQEERPVGMQALESSESLVPSDAFHLNRRPARNVYPMCAINNAADIVRRLKGLGIVDVGQLRWRTTEHFDAVGNVHVQRRSCLNFRLDGLSGEPLADVAYLVKIGLNIGSFAWRNALAGARFMGVGRKMAVAL